MARRSVKVLSVSVAVLLGLIGAEFFARVYVRRTAPSNAGLPQLFETLEGSERTFRLKPGAHVLGYEINSLGFRGVEFSRDKSPGTFRIVVIGDSIAFGMGVKSEDAVFARLLEKRLNTAGAAQRFEVINAGVPGYNSRQEWAFLRDEIVPRYAPDAIILSLCLNDADPIELDFQTQTLFTLQHQLERRSFNARAVINESYLFRIAKEAVLHTRPALRNRAINWRIHEKAWGEMKQYVAQMDEFAKRRGLKFLVAVFPWRPQLESRHDAAETQTDLAGFLEPRRIAYTDLFQAFQQRKDEGLFLGDGVHPSEVGHRLAAEELFRVLVARSIVMLTTNRLTSIDNGGDTERPASTRR